MELELDMGDMIYNGDGESRKEVRKLVRKAMSKMGKSWKTEAKRIIEDVDGIKPFADSISSRVFTDGDDIGFEGGDGVDYGVRYEFGDGDIPELKPFVNAMIKVQGEADEIFAEVFGAE
jgi:hypothetical protein